MGKTGIEITSVTDKIIGLKLPVVALEDLLNKQVTLTNYGTGVKKIFFVFIAVPSTNTIHEDYVVYTESEQHLEIAIRLDYESIAEADLAKCKEIMKTCFIEALRANRKVYSKNFNSMKLIKLLENSYF